MGHKHIKTPHLDKLAKESLLFRRGYIPVSLCRPSLMSMITGLHPFQHKITGNEPRKQKDKTKEKAEMIKMSQSHDMLQEILGREGYVSHQSGKWWEGNYKDAGFTHGMTRGFPQKRGRHGDDGLKIGREGLKPITDFIDKNVDNPFFIYYAPFMPHSPHTPPERLLNKYVKKTKSKYIANYWAMCEWFDETCGELLGHIDKKGLREKTLVIYVCDNGWIQTSTSRRYAPRSKRSQYEGGIRTPIMYRWPGVIKPEDSKALAISTDVVPTVMALLGLKKPKEMTGIDVLDENARNSRKRIFGDIYLHDALDIHNPAANNTYRWVIDGEYKLILPHPKNAPDDKIELFNVVKDPFEKKDLVKKDKKKVKELTKLINNWLPIE